MTNEIKVFAMNDSDWWAGATLEETTAAYAKEYEMSVEEACDGPHEISSEDMNRLMFVKDDAEKITFAEQLKLMITNGLVFPCFFASSEF